MDRAVEAGELSGLPVMVDFGYFLKERPYWRLVSEKLRKDDISTHCYRRSVVDGNGTVYPYLFRSPGKRCPVRPGPRRGKLPFPERRACTAQDSTPIPSPRTFVQSMNGAMMDMPTTMSKCLAMGMPLSDVIARSTAVPARMIGHPELGHLSSERRET